MQKISNTNKDKIWYYSNIFLFFLLVIGLVMLWAYFPSVLQWFDKSNTPIEIPYRPATEIVFNPGDRQTIAQKIGEKYGTYGDSYGALNTLFSGLAFAFLILSLFLQRNELKTQRDEIKAQRKEIKRSNKIAKQQRKIASQQAKLLKQQVKEAQVRNFYDLFFKYIETKEKKVKELYFENREKNFKGRNCFGPYSMMFKQNCKLLESYQNIEEDFFKKIESMSFLSIKFYEFDDAMGLPFKKSMYFDYIAFLINFIEKNSEIINSEEIIKVLFSYFDEDEIYCLLWIGTRNTIIYDFCKKYQIQQFIDAGTDVNYGVIDVLSTIYGFEDFVIEGISYRHE